MDTGEVNFFKKKRGAGGWIYLAAEYRGGKKIKKINKKRAGGRIYLADEYWGRCKK